jgi:hypothetical protein
MADAPALSFPNITPAPTNLAEWLVHLGLGNPLPRAVAVLAICTAACYALKWPGTCFKEDGLLKRFDISPDEENEERTQLHFALVPLVLFGAGYIFL